MPPLSRALNHEPRHIHLISRAPSFRAAPLILSLAEY
jgi:hypothetical protein